MKDPTLPRGCMAGAETPETVNQWAARETAAVSARLAPTQVGGELPEWAAAWERDPEREVLTGYARSDGLPWLIVGDGYNRIEIAHSALLNEFGEARCIPIRLRAHGEALARAAIAEAARDHATAHLADALGRLAEAEGERDRLALERADLRVCLEEELAEAGAQRERAERAERERGEAFARESRVTAEKDRVVELASRFETRAYDADERTRRAQEALSEWATKGHADRARISELEAERDRLSADLAQARDLRADFLAVAESYPVDAIAEWRRRATVAEGKIRDVIFLAEEAKPLEPKHHYNALRDILIALGRGEPDVSEGSVALADLKREG